MGYRSLRVDFRGWLQAALGGIGGAVLGVLAAQGFHEAEWLPLVGFILGSLVLNTQITRRPQTPPLPAISPLMGQPIDPGEVVDRTEELRLIRRLLAGPNQPNIVIDGVLGVGKSHVARKVLVDPALTHFFDLRVSIDLEGRDGDLRQTVTLLCDLQSALKETAGTQGRRIRCLVLIDNPDVALNSEAAARQLRELASLEYLTIIVAVRGSATIEAEVVTLTPLIPADACKLFVDTSGGMRGHEASTLALVEIAGYLPFAIRLLAEVAREVRSVSLTLVKIRRMGLAGLPGWQRSVEFSIRELLSPDARRFARLLAELRMGLGRLLVNPGGRWLSVEAAARAVGSGLASASPDRIEMPRPIREYLVETRAVGPAELRQAASELTTVLVDVSAAAVADHRFAAELLTGGLELTRMLSAVDPKDHATRIVSLAQASYVGEIELEDELMNFVESAEYATHPLRTLAAKELLRRLEHLDARAQFERFFRLVSAELDPIERVHFEMNVHAARGDLKGARESLTQYHALATQSGSAGLLAHATRELASRQGSHALAIDMLTHALHITEDDAARHKIIRASILCNIGLHYLDSGKTENAEPLLKIAARLFGEWGDSHYLGNSMSGLAEVSRRRGDLEEAIKRNFEARRLYVRCRSASGITRTEMYLRLLGYRRHTDSGLDG